MVPLVFGHVGVRRARVVTLRAIALGVVQVGIRAVGGQAVVGAGGVVVVLLVGLSRRFL